MHLANIIFRFFTPSTFVSLDISFLFLFTEFLGVFVLSI